MKVYTLLRQCLLSLLLFGASGAALADPLAVEGVPVHFGDTVEAVQKALNTTLEPEVMQTTGPQTGGQQKTMIRLKTRGIWVFFNAQHVVETIRLNAPFPGNVGGARLGMYREDLLKKLGNPASVMPSKFVIPGQSPPVFYVVDQNTEARFDFDRDEQVMTIFLINAAKSQ